MTTQEEIQRRFAEINAEQTEPMDDVADDVPKTDEAEGKPVIQQEPEVDHVALAREEQRKADARYYSLQGEHKRLKEELEELRHKPTVTSEVIKFDENEGDDPDFRLLVDEYGESGAKAMQNMTAKVASAYKRELDSVREELNQTKATTGRLAEVAEQSSQERFFSDLGRQIPDWKEVNDRASTFYDQVEPFTGETYDTLIKHYGKTGDVARVAKIIEAARATITPATPVNKPANKLEQMIEPDRSGRGTPPPVNSEQKVFTRAEVDRVKRDYTDFQTGRLKANPEKMQAKFEEIKQALAEGRVQ